MYTTVCTSLAKLGPAAHLIPVCLRSLVFFLYQCSLFGIKTLLHSLHLAFKPVQQFCLFLPFFTWGPAKLKILNILLSNCVMCETSAYTLSNNGLLSIINKLGWNLGIMRCLQFNSVIPYLYVSLTSSSSASLSRSCCFSSSFLILSCSTVSLRSTAEAISSSSCCFSFRWSCTVSSRSLRICSSRSSNAYRSNVRKKWARQ